MNIFTHEPLWVLIKPGGQAIPAYYCRKQWHWIRTFQFDVFFTYGQQVQQVVA